MEDVPRHSCSNVETDFPAHPHRGFETITVVLEGLVDHFDSGGSTGGNGFGDVQWMTAGSGLQHSDMFPLVNQDKPNRSRSLFQIWINILPSKDKMTELQVTKFSGHMKTSHPS